MKLILQHASSVIHHISKNGHHYIIDYTSSTADL